MTLTLLEYLALGLWIAAIVLGLIRLLLGPGTLDRVVAADTLAVITTAGLAGIAAVLGSALYLDVALIYGALSFVGIVAIARAIEGSRQ